MKYLPIFGIELLGLTCFLDVGESDILSVLGNTNFLVLQIEVCVEPVEETITQEDHIILRVLCGFDVSLAVEGMGGLFGILFALLEIKLFLYHILIATDVEGEGGKLIEIADLA